MTAQTYAPQTSGAPRGSRPRPHSRRSPSAVRRGSSLLLTAGLVGSGLVLGSGAAHADDDFEPQDSTNDVPLEYPENQQGEDDITGGYGPDAELEDSEGNLTEAGEFYNSDAEFWAPESQSRLLGTQSSGNQAIGSSADEETGLFAGQSLRYEVQVDLREYARLAAGYEDAGDVDFEIRHTLPEGISAQPGSVEFHSSSGEHGGGSLLTGDDFSADIRGDNDDLLRILLDDNWLADNVLSGNEYTTLYLTFDASVDDDAQQYAQLSAQAYQQIVVPQPAQYDEVEGEDGETEYEQTNEGERDTYRFYADPSSVQVLGADPEQRVLDTSGDPVGDRVAVGGDLLDFEVTLDGTFAGEVEVYDEDLGETETVQEHTDPAYDIESFGLVETFDADVLSIDPDSVTIDGFSADEGGYSVEVDNSSGELQIFTADPDDDWIGKDRTVNYQAVVQDVSEDASASVETTQVIDDAEFTPEETSSVEIAAIAPSKAAVVIDNDGEVTEVEEVEHESQFHYRVTSSETPENALYPVNDWGVIDELTRGDQSLHEDFEVRAETDITDSSGETVFAAGDVIDEDYFNLTVSGDSYAVDARDSFTELIGDSEAQWSVYVAATRTANPGVDTSNTGIEVRNGADRSASLTTGTVAADDEDGSDEESAELDLSLDVAGEVTQGETLEVSGTGFTPEGEVEVSLNPDETFTADDEGSFSGELQIPEDAQTGDRELVATDAATGETVSAQVSITERSTDDSDDADSDDESSDGSQGPGSGVIDEDEDDDDDESVAASSTGSSSPEDSGDADDDESEESGISPDADDDGSDGAQYTQPDGDASPSGLMSDDRHIEDEESDRDQLGGAPDTPDTDEYDSVTGGDGPESQAGEDLGRTGANSPWLIGGGALLLLTAGAGAAYFHRLRGQLGQ